MFERMRRGWELTKKAWGVVRSHPGLAKLPVVGGLLALLWSVLLTLPGALLLAADQVSIQVGGAVMLAAGIYLSSFSVIYFNVALAAAADQALMGREPDLRVARAAARARLGAIAGWALISVVVGVLIQVIRDRAGAAGNLLASIGATIWGLVTFLVVPVIAFEEIGPVDAMKRSASLFRERWGQQVTGNLVIGGVSGIVLFVGLLMAGGGIALMVAGGAAATAGGAVLLAVGVIVAIAAAVFSGAVRGVFGVALYHYVAEDATLGPFTDDDLASAARSR